VRRREFIKITVGSVLAWPLAARAQQPDRKARIGVLMNRSADNPEGQARLSAFQQALLQFGWSTGQNAQIDIRWGEDDVDLESKYATELVALAPDIVMASGTLSVAALRRASRALPVVFVGVTDPVGAGFVDSLAKPGGNVTGFMIYEFSFGAKRLELLNQIAPTVERVAVLRDAANSAATAEFAAIQAAAQSLRLEATPIDSGRDLNEIERAITAFVRYPNSGLILTPSSAATVLGNYIVALAAKQRVPAVYPFRYMVTDGGLTSLGPNVVDQCRLAAGYVDRILKGEKPATLPVQAPTKYELVINLRTAKALDLDVSPTLVARADEVIE
jgi:putative tryptophan/tyrosine transport system substrate-binding protein